MRARWVEITRLIIHSSFRIGPLISLFAMAIACGNIKPCLAAFGGDQFRKDQVSPVFNQDKQDKQVYIFSHYQTCAITCNCLRPICVSNCINIIQQVPNYSRQIKGLTNCLILGIKISWRSSKNTASGAVPCLHNIVCHAIVFILGVTQSRFWSRHAY